MTGELALVQRVRTRADLWRGRRPPVRPLVDAMMNGDLREARELSEQFLGRAGSRVAVFADLLQPAQYEIGDMWYRGHIGIEDEHRAAVVLERLVGLLPPTPVRPPVPSGSRCLLAVLPGESHTLGLRMLAHALEDEGWRVDLVAGDGARDLLGEVDRSRPRLVGISAGYLPETRTLAQVVAAIRQRSLPVLVGGAAFNRVTDLWRRVGASGHGADARIGAVLARRLARSSGQHRLRFCEERA
jgi:MerR family transcriptional regulator, light-induced transcriptional regulator